MSALASASYRWLRRFATAAERGEGDARAMSSGGVSVAEAGVEFSKVFSGDAAVVGAFGAGADEKVRERIEPRLVPLAGLCGQLNTSTWRDDDDAFPMQTQWRGVVVRDHPDGLDCHAFSLHLRTPSGGRITVGPVKCPCVGMDPEEPAVAVVRHLAPTSFACVLP